MSKKDYSYSGLFDSGNRVDCTGTAVRCRYCNEEIIWYDPPGNRRAFWIHVGTESPYCATGINSAAPKDKQTVIDMESYMGLCVRHEHSHALSRVNADRRDIDRMMREKMTRRGPRGKPGHPTSPSQAHGGRSLWNSFKRWWRRNGITISLDSGKTKEKR